MREFFFAFQKITLRVSHAHGKVDWILARVAHRRFGRSLISASVAATHARARVYITTVALYFILTFFPLPLAALLHE
jgi:hypothetical protein